MFWLGVAVGSLFTLVLVVVYSACVVSGRISQKEEAMSVHVNGRLVYTAPGVKKRPGIDDYRRALAIMAKKYCLYPDVAFENALEEAMEKVPD
jgi:hypothetical protein